MKGQPDLALLLSEPPGAVVVKKAKHFSASVDGKVFAYTNSRGVVLKLPEMRVAELESAGTGERLVMGKRRMSEWTVVAPSMPVDDIRSILSEAARFVAGGKARG